MSPRPQVVRHRTYALTCPPLIQHIDPSPQDTPPAACSTLSAPNPPAYSARNFLSRAGSHIPIRTRHAAPSTQSSDEKVHSDQHPNLSRLHRPTIRQSSAPFPYQIANLLSSNRSDSHFHHFRYSLGSAKIPKIRAPPINRVALSPILHPAIPPIANQRSAGEIHRTSTVKPQTKSHALCAPKYLY